MSDLTVINMWCGPRTVSTALMYAWRQRPDVLVVDEPFYGLWLRDHDPGHPGREEVLAAMPLELPAILDAVRRPDPRPVRFIKNIGHHLDALPPAILDEYANGLLIRDPARIVASLAATIRTEIPITITALTQQVAILDHDLAAGRAPVVVDADRLLADPSGVLTALCGSFDLDFDEAMLSWPPGPKPEDGVWAPHWYRSVHATTGFGSPPSTPVELDGANRELAERCRPLYDRLLAHHLEG